MKLKYYLRGLAVGVILTTIVLAVANGDNRPMTDAEIRQRALALGMIESDSLKLSDVGEPVDTSVSESNTGESAESDSALNVSSEIQSAESETSTADGAGSPGKPPVSTEATVPSEPESIETGAAVIITIKSGDSSYTVSKALAAAGLVEDAVEYDNYLCNYGYSRKIRTGTYEIVPGMSFEEIANIIAR